MSDYPNGIHIVYDHNAMLHFKWLNRQPAMDSGTGAEAS